ncbi:MAG: AI-2E family transporter [Deltaproteobacteria bacterium]|nr:AI-2E family transporter [Deltaproteobacteria bacterium]
MDDLVKHTTKKTSALVILASFVIVVAGMKAANSLLVPFFLAIFIAVICAPPMFWLQRKGLPKVLALSLILVAILLIGFLFGLLIVPSLNDFLSSLPDYQKQLSSTMADLIIWMRGKGINIPQKELTGALHPGWVMTLAGDIFSALSNVFANAFMILLAVVFILLEAADFPVKLRVMLKNPEKSLSAIEKFSQNAKRYLVIKTAVSALEGVVIWLWLIIIGIDYPILWGTLSFLMNFIPNIGAMIAALPAVLLALVQYGPWSALLTGVGFIVVNVVLGNLVEPKLMGKGLNLSTLVVFFSMVLWGWVLGPVGMILSVPMTSLAKIAFESYEETRGIAVMLGSSHDDG